MMKGVSKDACVQTVNTLENMERIQDALSTEVLFEIKSVTLAGFFQVYSMLRDTAQRVFEIGW